MSQPTNTNYSTQQPFPQHGYPQQQALNNRSTIPKPSDLSHLQQQKQQLQALMQQQANYNTYSNYPSPQELQQARNAQLSLQKERSKERSIGICLNHGNTWAIPNNTNFSSQQPFPQLGYQQQPALNNRFPIIQPNTNTSCSTHPQSQHFHQPNQPVLDNRFTMPQLNNTNYSSQPQFPQMSFPQPHFSEQSGFLNVPLMQVTHPQQPAFKSKRGIKPYSPANSLLSGSTELKNPDQQEKIQKLNESILMQKQVVDKQKKELTIEKKKLTILQRNLSLLQDPDLINDKKANQKAKKNLARVKKDLQKIELAESLKQISPSQEKIDLLWQTLKAKTSDNFAQINSEHKDDSIPCIKTAILVDGHSLHANIISGNIKENDLVPSKYQFVAAQAPLKENKRLFWQWIAENEYTIIDLTTDYNHYNGSAHQYVVNEGCIVGQRGDHPHSPDPFIHFNICLSGKLFEVDSLSYAKWNQRGIKFDLPSLIRYVDIVKNSGKTKFWSHSRDGVEETGHFITAVLLNERIENKEITKENLEDKLIDLIYELRLRRGPDFVQNEEQFALLYRYGLYLLNPK